MEQRPWWKKRHLPYVKNSVSWKFGTIPITPGDRNGSERYRSVPCPLQVHLRAQQGEAKNRHDRTPVITSQKIAMTVPVIISVHRMSFVMPAHFTFATLPVPLDPRVQLGEQAEKTVAVLRFKGHAADREVARKMNELLALRKQQHKKAVGKSFLLRYNAPYVPGFMRRNRVVFEVESK